MLNPEKLPEELGFLNWISTERYAEYRSSQWVKTPFENSIWKFNFDSKREFEIDFRVLLEDGSLLTDDSNYSLLEVFKCWICIQTHFDVTGGVTYSAMSANNTIRMVLVLIDYFLLNAKHFNLAQYGLTNITENDFVALLAQLASSNENSTSIYKWTDNLTNYLQKELEKTDINSLHEVINQYPFLALGIPDEEDWMLNLTKDEIIFSRALFWRDGYYKKSVSSINQNQDSFRYALNTLKISQKLYANTLVGVNSKPQPIEFFLSPIDRYYKEYGHAPVRGPTDDICSEKVWGRYKKSIRSLGQLAEIGLHVPVNALKPINTLVNQDSFLLKPDGRFRTLPNKTVLNSLSRSIEFLLFYGQDLLDSVIAVIKAAQIKNVSCYSFADSNDIQHLLTPKIRAMGVKVWHLGFHMNKNDRDLSQKGGVRPTSYEFFRRFRKNEGLYELLRVFYGAVQICIGTLMARRQSELIDLIAGKALDKSKSYLVFYNRKSGLGDMREVETRPIPPVAVKLIELLDQFHAQLVKVGLSTKDTQLFAYPGLHSGEPIKLSSTQYNDSLDFFCDYIETDLNADGERYYIRQHQLRRFFAMMFFWGNSFGGMETLRWFLGHTDPEHLYHYITESIPGNVLRASKAHFVGEQIKLNSEESLELASIVEKHFGTRDFSVLDNDELDEYIEELLIQGQVEIKPIFFVAPEGKSYRIAIKVLNKI